MSKVASKTQNGKRKTNIDSDDIIFIGVDVHKNSYAVAIHTQKLGLVKDFVMDAEPWILVTMLEPLKKRIERVVYEAGPTGYSLARQLRSAGIRTSVVNSGKIPRPSTDQTKTDRIDCRKLAEFAAKDLLEYIAIPVVQQDVDRQLSRLRDQILQSVQKTKNRIKSFLLYNGIEEPEGLKRWTLESVKALKTMKLNPELRFNLDMRLEELSSTKEHLKKINARIIEMEKEERYIQNSTNLRTISGIGVITAMKVLMEFIQPERFSNEREVAKFMGLSPRLSESGTTTIHNGLSPSGNRRLRTCLVEAAWRWRNRDSRAAARYDVLRKNTGNPKKAIVGLARKLGVIMWRMITREEPYKRAS
jgi:transposase